MKLLNKLILLTGCTLLLTACPYESSTPLESDNDAIVVMHERLPGRWVYKTNEDSLVLNVSKTTEGITIKMTDTEGETTNFKGTLSSINGIEFINLSNTDRSPAAYHFVKYEIKSDKLRAYYAADKYISNYIQKGQDLRTFFIENANKKGFWTNKMTFTKSGD